MRCMSQKSSGPSKQSCIYLVNMVCIRVVLLVHDTLMLSKLKAKYTSVEQTQIVDPLRLEGIAVEELVLACKCKALELESIKQVEGYKDG